MVNRRSTAPRKRSVQESADLTSAGRLAVPVSGDKADDGGESSSFDIEAFKGELVSQIESLLRDTPGIGQEDRDAIVGQFASAMQEEAHSAQSGGSVAASLQEGIDQLREYATQADGGADGLIHHLNEALAPLERRETKIAMEFSRRLESDGQESALAWLREQQTSEQDTVEQAQAVPTDYQIQASDDETTKSRSRRLRGPPGQRPR